MSALLTTILILITENRQNRHADERAQLDLQVNLLAERKIAKVIALLEELRRDLPSVRDRVDPEADAMEEAMDPLASLSALRDLDPEGLGEPDRDRDGDGDDQEDGEADEAHDPDR